MEVDVWLPLLLLFARFPCVSKECVCELDPAAAVAPKWLKNPGLCGPTTGAYPEYRLKVFLPPDPAK